jgi:hypothetical protein
MMRRTYAMAATTWAAVGLMAAAAEAQQRPNIVILATFKESPPRQKAASFNLEEVMRKMSEGPK